MLSTQEYYKKLLSEIDSLKEENGNLRKELEMYRKSLEETKNLNKDLEEELVGLRAFSESFD